MDPVSDLATAQTIIDQMDRGIFDPRLFVSLGIEDRDLYVGEPITVSWQIFDFGSLAQFTLGDGISTAHVEISIDIPTGTGVHRVYPAEDTPPGAAPREITLQLTQEQQRDIYHIWNRTDPSTVTLRVTAQGEPLPRPLVREIHFGIQQEGGTGALWTWADFWQASDWRAATQWNADYVLRGWVRNPSQFSGMNVVDVTLHEAVTQSSYDPDRPFSAPVFWPPQVLQMQHRDRIPTGPARAEFVFSPIKQTWPWLAPHIWVLIGPLAKRFRYTVGLVMFDDYENPYAVLSEPMEFTIRVSDEKLEAQGLALAALVGSATFAVGAIVWPWLALGAGAASIGAEAAGQIALDPPNPDSSFAELVSLPTFNPLNEKNVERHALNELLHAINWLLTSRQTLFVIEGKMMGARRGKDAQALKRQTKDYQKLVRRMWGVSKDLTRLTKEAVKDVAEVSANQELMPKLLGWSEYGIPNGDWEKLASAGLSSSILASLEIALKNAQVRQSLAAPNVAIAHMASATLRLMREVVAATFATVTPARLVKDPAEEA